jgi:REP element-mobilizing transposase RayT
MANTYTQLYVQGVFAVHSRQNLIFDTHAEEVRKYICGIVTNPGSKPIAVNTMPDHCHILIGLKPTISISELLGKVKSGSSGFINKQRFVPGRFEWQDGFGAFLSAYSQLNTIIAYINNKAQHHRKKSFHEEYIELLDEFKIEFDERYIFKEIQP